MSEERELAREAASFCVACLSFSWTAPALGAVILPAITLLGIGAAIWQRCPARACASAVNAVLADMSQSGAIPPARMAAARRALTIGTHGSPTDARRHRRRCPQRPWFCRDQRLRPAPALGRIAQ